MFGQTQGNLAPFIQGGQSSLGQLLQMLPSLTKTFNPTMQDLEQTPGYKFVLDQGLKSTQNAFAGQGLASSGAALKGATNYAEGLAGTTFQQQFENYLKQNQQQFNMLYTPAAMGENAAAGMGSLATQTGGQIGSNLVGAGNAQAGASMATAGAIGGAATGGVNSYLQYNLLQQLMARQGGITAPSAVANPNLASPAIAGASAGY
jgi:hypothetical protein